MNIEERAKKIKAVIFDVDGVLTNGEIGYGNHGDELKFFDVQDGLGMQLLRKANLYTFIISGRFSKVTLMRAKEVQITRVFQNIADKLIIYERLKKKFKLKDSEFCCLGDDIIDLPVLRRAGLACAVLNAQEEVKKEVHYVTKFTGGHGAVREVCDIILKSQGKWEKLTKKYYR